MACPRCPQLTLVSSQGATTAGGGSQGSQPGTSSQPTAATCGTNAHKPKQTSAPPAANRSITQWARKATPADLLWGAGGSASTSHQPPPAVTDTYTAPTGSEFEDQAWTDKHRPSNSSDLAVHKKKVEDVRRWLEAHVPPKPQPQPQALRASAPPLQSTQPQGGAAAHPSAPRLLIVTGVCVCVRGHAVVCCAVSDVVASVQHTAFAYTGCCAQGACAYACACACAHTPQGLQVVARPLP
jgi:cell cycle checkpoint protein